MNEYVESKVAAPGMALAVVGGLAIAGNLLLLLLQVLSAVSTIMSLLQAEAGIDGWITWGTSQGWVLLYYFACFLVGFPVLAAGLRLRAARSAGLVYAGSIFAMLPCCVGTPCCCLGLPVGLWAIMTMQDDQVKAAFAEG